MQERLLGRERVSAIGLGAMPMSVEGRPSREQAIRTIHAALDHGVTLIDTADSYHVGADEVGHNESLVAEAVKSWSGDRDQVVVATKGGHLRPGDGSWTQNARPEYLKSAAKASLSRLGGDAIDLYQFHRPDIENVPFEDSMGAIVELLHEGVARQIGISNVNSAQIRTAYDMLDGQLVSVQNRLSPSFRSSEPEVELCEELEVAFLAWGPLGRTYVNQLTADFEPFAKVAEDLGVTPQVVCLAWLLQKSDRIIPIPGSTRPETILNSITAIDVSLSPAEVGFLDAASTSTAGQQK